MGKVAVADQGTGFSIRVKKPIVNVRPEPGGEALITQVRENDIFVVSQDSLDAESRHWYRIQLPSNKSGWIASWLVDKIQASHRSLEDSEQSIDSVGTKFQELEEIKQGLEEIIAGFEDQKREIGKLYQEISRLEANSAKNTNSLLWIGSIGGLSLLILLLVEMLVFSKRGKKWDEKLGKLNKLIMEHEGRFVSQDEYDRAIAELRRDIQRLAKKLSEASIGASSSPEENEDETESLTLQGLVDVYNGAVEDTRRRREFQRLYRVARFGVKNAEERLRQGNVTPVLQRADNGDFYVISTSQVSSFLVFPRLGMRIDDYNFSTNAIGEIFDCRGYSSGHVYDLVMLKEPAVFGGSPNTLNWPPVKKGILEFVCS